MKEYAPEKKWHCVIGEDYSTKEIEYQNHAFI